METVPFSGLDAFTLGLCDRNYSHDAGRKMTGNYPDGDSCPQKSIVELHCDCGARWEVEVIKDLGMSDFVKEDAEKCPECGKWVE